MSDFNVAIQTVLKNEGGFVNDPRDAGGATQWGISLRFLQDPAVDGDFDGDGDQDVDDVRAMTREQAIESYRAVFWDALRLGEIEDQQLATKMLDLAVNVGKVAAVKILQRALGIAVDGVLGPQTIAACNGFIGLDSADRMATLRLQAIAYYASIPAAKSQPFLRGWILRALA